MQDLGRAFAQELSTLSAKMDWPKWKDTTIRLECAFNQEGGAKVSLVFIGGGLCLEAASLDELIAEVYRRLDFEDRQKAKIQQRALAAPQAA